MRTETIRRWSAVHKWTSLICTAFLLMLCVTGLPLIFQDELEAWLTPGPTLKVLPAGTPKVSVDRVVDAARKRHPQEVVTSVGLDDEEPFYSVGMESPATPAGQDTRVLLFHARTADLLEDIRALDRPPDALLVIYQLHFQMYAGLPGRLFLGAMGLLFAVAIVSGVVLYGPFTRRLDFGEIRVQRGRRVRWLDLHNLLGIVVLAWSLIVGITGAMNTVAQPLYTLWRSSTVPLLPKSDRSGHASGKPLSPQQAITTAQAHMPGYTARSIFMPSERGFAIPKHYLVWLQGNSALTARLFEPVLVDAQSGTVAETARSPWYLRTLDLSRPLHFGDYGGMPLKILWAILDLVTIVVLGSGIYLWIARKKRGTAAETRSLVRLESAE